MDPYQTDIIDYIEMPIFVLEPDVHRRPVYRAYNKAACEGAGLREEDIIGKTALEVYPYEYSKTVYELHVKALATPHALVYESLLPLKGEPQLIRTYLNPVINKDNVVVKLVGSCNIISDPIELSDANPEPNELRELESFINLAAHDLRSPIKNMHTLIDFLRDGFKDMGDGKLQVLDHLEKVAGGALRMIGDLLNHAQTLSSPMIVEPFELSTICEDIALLFDPAQKHSFAIAPVTIHGDRVATQVILRNLIDNAIKHNEGRTLTLSIAATQLSKDLFSIDFSDDGRGIEDPLRLFTPLRTKDEGAGYGLLAIQKVIHSRGGSIIANSDNTGGTGATITFTLPGKIISKDNAQVA